MSVDEQATEVGTVFVEGSAEVAFASFARRLTAEGSEGFEVTVTDAPNRHWERSERGSAVTVRHDVFIDPSTSVFTIGSCFAMNLRAALQDRGFHASPDMSALRIDPSSQQAGHFGVVSYYDTFGIRQEFSRIFAAMDGRAPEGFAPGSELDVAPVGIRPTWRVENTDWQPAVQDPMRQYVFAADDRAMAALTEQFDELMCRAIDEADVYIITLGLIECWRDLPAERFAWGVKACRIAAEPDRFAFHLSDYAENLANVRWVIDELTRRYPEKRIVLTVSPVGLNQTFTDNDVVVANTYSKSVLRAVAGTIDAEYEGVTYWPSYELALQMDVYEDDGRHVSGPAVAFIIDSFLDAHAELAPPS